MPQLANHPAWQCPHCHAVSYSPEDLKWHYCGRCNHFCDDVDGSTSLVVLTTGRARGMGSLVTTSWDEAFAEGRRMLEGGATEIQIKRFQH